MNYKEENLKKLIEYEDLPIKTFFNKISSVLGLEYFEDGETLTVASISFVLDISSKNIKLIFVEEMYYSYFTYVELYFNFFYRNKDYLSLYNVIKFFSALEGNGYNEDINLEYANPTCCKCVMNYDYCINLNFADVVKKEKTYNIFTHRQEKQLIDNIFIGIPVVHNNLSDDSFYVCDEDLNRCLNLFYLDKEDKYNLSYFYDIRMLNVDVFKYFKNNFFFKETFLDRTIEIRNNLTIFVDGEYNMNLSFLFKRGFSLFAILNLSEV